MCFVWFYYFGGWVYKVRIVNGIWWICVKILDCLVFWFKESNDLVFVRVVGMIVFDGDCFFSVFYCVVVLDFLVFLFGMV